MLEILVLLLTADTLGAMYARSPHLSRFVTIKINSIWLHTVIVKETDLQEHY